MLFFASGFAIEAPAADNSKLPRGADHEAAHAKSTGAGIRIGIIEFPAGGPGDPSSLGIINDPANVGDYNNLGARLKEEWNFDNKDPGDAPVAVGGAAGTGAWHTTLVADIAAGSQAKYTGVAPGADVYFGGLDPSADPAGNNSFRAAADWLHENKSVNIFNLSTRILDTPGNDNGDNVTARFVDYFARTRDVLFIKSAGNRGGPTGDNQISNPGDAFNAITVGATDENFVARANYSSYWLTGDDGTGPDRRGKPDILAPGSDIYDGHIEFKDDGTATLHQAVTDAAHPENDGTSFAAPHVTGVAALLAAGTTDAPAGLPLGGVDDDRNHLAIKSIILNSARKRNIPRPKASHALATDYDGGFFYDHDGNAGTPDIELPSTANEESDGDYLPGGNLVASLTSVTGPKTAEWTPSTWFTSADKVLTVTEPLDDEQGTGVLDAERALILYEGGEQEEKTEDAAGIDRRGWNRERLSADFGMDEYEFNFAVPAGSFITTTLVWDRVLNEMETGGGGADDMVEKTDTYVDDPFGLGFLPDFDLFVYKDDNIIARSIAGGGAIRGLDAENVEHLHFPLQEDCEAFQCSIRVDLLGNGLRTYDYALSWWAVPEPSSMILAAIGLLVIGGCPRRRRTRISLKTQ